MASEADNAQTQEQNEGNCGCSPRVGHKGFSKTHDVIFKVAIIILLSLLLRVSVGLSSYSGFKF